MSTCRAEPTKTYCEYRWNTDSGGPPVASRDATTRTGPGVAQPAPVLQSMYPAGDKATHHDNRCGDAPGNRPETNEYKLCVRPKLAMT